VRIDPAACFFWALLLLILPLNWLLAAMLAATVHECCHLLFLLLLGGEPGLLHISTTGAKLDVGELSYFQELICAAAGPAGSLSLLFLAQVYPQLSVCGLIQGLFNLIPVYPLDGGRILRCVISLLAPTEWSGKLCSFIQYLFLGLMTALFFILPFKNLLLPVLLLVWIQFLRGKIPCKPPQLRVQ